MTVLTRRVVAQWAALGPRFLPFADAASADLPLPRLLRLALFQVSVGAAMVLLVGQAGMIRARYFAALAPWLSPDRALHPFFPYKESAMSLMSRRVVVLGSLAAALSVPMIAQAQNKKLKVAAIYTVPVEQQWVSRIHKALNAAVARGDIEYVFSENVANADYERVMRQYAEAKNDFIIGESFAVEAAARKVAKEYPKIAFLMGSSGMPQAPNFSVFDNYIQEPAYLTGMIAGGMTKSNKIGMVGGFPIPEVNRLMHAFMAGAREVNPKV